MHSSEKQVSKRDAPVFFKQRVQCIPHPVVCNPVSASVHPPGILAQTVGNLWNDNPDVKPRAIAYNRLDRFFCKGIPPTEHDDVTLPKAMHPEGLTIPALQLDYTLSKQPAIGLGDQIEQSDSVCCEPAVRPLSKPGLGHREFIIQFPSYQLEI